MATKTTFYQIVYGFVIVFAIALFMNGIGRKLRAHLAGRLGSFYDYFVLPGCLCHEAGRTLGCFVSGVGVDRFEIFNLDTDDSVRIPIAVSVNKRFAFIRRFLILTGPMFYLLFCIGSQTRISGSSLLLIWQSILCVFVLLFVLNLIPGVNAGRRARRNHLLHCLCA